MLDKGSGRDGGTGVSWAGPKGEPGPPGVPEGCLWVEDDRLILEVPCLACDGKMESSPDDWTLWYCYACGLWIERRLDGDMKYNTVRMDTGASVLVPRYCLLVVRSEEEP